jgi:hypothetical protein
MTTWWRKIARWLAGIGQVVYRAKVDRAQQDKRFVERIRATWRKNTEHRVVAIIWPGLLDIVGHWFSLLLGLAMILLVLFELWAWADRSLRRRALRKAERDALPAWDSEIGKDE